MALRISDLDTLGVGAISKDDMFEIERKADRKSYNTSAQAIAEFCKTVSNGGYKGNSTKSLDEFTYQDAGVYYWSGTPALTGMASEGILEILSATPPSESTTEAPTLIERLCNGKNVWCRQGHPGNWSDWAALTNANGNTIFSSQTSDAAVTFPAKFKQVPTVVCTPLNASDDALYLINVTNVSISGFQVKRFKLNMKDPKTTTTTTTNNTYTTAGNDQKLSSSSTTEEVVVTNNSWTTDNADFSYSWIATTDG